MTIKNIRNTKTSHEETESAYLKDERNKWGLNKSAQHNELYR